MSVSTLVTGISARPEKADCESCTLSEQPFVGPSGPSKARVAIVGEGPGAMEVTKGIPFVGQAGGLLNAVLDEVGIDRAQCFVTNSVCCRPPENRNPTSKEISACKPRLLWELECCGPDIIILLGNIAMRAALGIAGISKMHGSATWSDIFKAWVIPTYHPAAVLRNQGLYIDLVRDLRKATRVLERPPASPRINGVHYVVLENKRDVDELCARLKEVGRAASDGEWSSRGELLCAGFSWRMGTAVEVPRRVLDMPYTKERLNSAAKEITLGGHNFKSDTQVYWNHGLTNVRVGFDTMLKHYCLDSRQGTHDLEQLAGIHFNDSNYDREVKQYITHMEDCPEDLMWQYNAKDVSYTVGLDDIFSEDMTNDNWRVYNEMLIPASHVLARMEHLGCMVDMPYLRRLDGELRAKAGKLEAEMIAAAGVDFNPNSPKQITEILYTTLELPVPGRLSTDEAALNEIADYHPLPRLLLEYRKTTKFHSTYVESFLEKADSNSRIHGTFNLHGTETSRLSSSGPNLQNIPRGPVARNIFIATPGYTLVQGDLSQAEVRVLAWYCKDKNLLDALQSSDIHTRTASMMFGVPPEEVTKEMRTRAKRITFGNVYCMSPQGLVDDLKDYGTVVSLSEAEELQEKFFASFPRVREWTRDIQAQGLREGKITTPFGRTRNFDFIISKNRNAIKREIVNTPIQSSAADLTLKALIRLGRRFEGSEDTRLLSTVHDSIMLETREDPLEIAKIVKEEMSQPLDDVPMKADIEIGERWGSLKEVKV